MSVFYENGHMKTDVISENGHLLHGWCGKLFSLFTLAWLVASELSSAGHIVNSGDQEQLYHGE